MHKINYYTCPTHWKNVAKAQPSENRNKRRYVYTMNPGKPIETSIPLVYVLKSIDLINYKKNIRDYILRKAVLINNVCVKDKRAPVGLYDYITFIDQDNKKQTYQLRFERNDLLNIKCYPVLKKCVSEKNVQAIKKYFVGPKNTLKVQTFQGSIYTFENNKENIERLKNLFTVVEIQSELKTITLKDYTEEYNLLVVTRVTGKNKFKTYTVDGLEKITDGLDLIRYKLKLKSELNNFKEEILSKNDFKKLYTYALIHNVSIE